ncbi:hypothetical protein OPV22_022955 [Ensete ventricosum]|uniref:Uncharacterized protein n=1 Tax=Ensete ventricosum TaxID=4639 RepID=A0AAV8QQY8_ENSVE|nr:hypothetical protein OPV22_022955 [Ensete ventricosum]
MAGKLLRKLKDMLKHRPHSSHHRLAAAGPSSDAACGAASMDGGDKQDPDSSGGAGTVVGCEVVLFDHLLWMLVNADLQPDSVDELVEYYTC